MPFDLDRYSSSYFANSSSRDFFLGREALFLLDDLTVVSSICSLAVPHEPQNFTVDFNEISLQTIKALGNIKSPTFFMIYIAYKI